MTDKIFTDLELQLNGENAYLRREIERLNNELNVHKEKKTLRENLLRSQRDELLSHLREIFETIDYENGFCKSVAKSDWSVLAERSKQLLSYSTPTNAGEMK